MRGCVGFDCPLGSARSAWTLAPTSSLGRPSLPVRRLSASRRRRRESSRQRERFEFASRPPWAPSTSRSTSRGRPFSASNFLRYVDAGRYDGGRFHRTVTVEPDNQPQQHGEDRGDPGRRRTGTPEASISRRSRSSALATPVFAPRRLPVDGARRARTRRPPTSSSASATSRNSTSAAGATPTARASRPSGGWSRAWTWCAGSSDRLRKTRP